jgi:hypothetical protein
MGSAAPFDPELLYVECASCGEPVIWEPGKSTEILHWSGMSILEIDATCMIVSQGCPHCTPEEEFFDTQIVRLSNEAFA